MKKNIKYIFALLAASAFFLLGCEEEKYELGDLNAPTNLVITTEIVGQNAANPNGNGSGDVKITLSANNAIAYKIGYNKVEDNVSPTLTSLPSGSVTKRFEDPGVIAYRITAVAYGAGGTSTVVTKDITVRSDFNMDPTIVQNLTNGSSKAWVVDKSVPAHLRIGPWDDPSTIWWSAAIDEKVACCNCFYTATYTFTVTPSNTYNLAVNSPDGIFMNRNAAENNLGVSGAGEACHPWTQPTKDIAFGNSASSFPAGLPSEIASTTGYKITVDGNDGFIGYGSCSNTYEIIECTPTYLYLRSRGVNQGNFWYLKLKPAP